LRLGAVPIVENGQPEWLKKGSCRSAVVAELMQQVALGDGERVARLVPLVGTENRPTDLAAFGGDSPLHWAASFGQADLCDKLVDLGFAINATNDDGATPLCEAAKASQIDVVRRLLDLGADSSLAVSDGRDAGKTPLMLAKTDTIKTVLEEAATIQKPSTQNQDAVVSSKEDKQQEQKVNEEQKVDEIEGTAANKRHVQPPPEEATVCRAPLIWPPPRRVRLLRGREDFVLSCSTTIDVGVEDASTCATCVEILSRLLRARLEAVEVRRSPQRFAQAKIRFRLCKSTSGGPEAYRVVCDENGIVITATDIPGLSYGASTLAQLLRFYATADTSHTTLTLPAVAVDDGPDARWRASILDLRGHTAGGESKLADDVAKASAWRTNTLFFLLDDHSRCLQLARSAYIKCQKRSIRFIPTFLIDEELPSALLAAVAHMTSDSICLKLPAAWCDGELGEDKVILDKFVAGVEAAALAVSAAATNAVLDDDDIERLDKDKKIRKSVPNEQRVCIWLWGAGVRSQLACEAKLLELEVALEVRCSCAVVADGSVASLGVEEAARFASGRACAADCLVVGGADASRPTALRQAPLIASLVAAARTCRADRSAGVLIRGAPLEPAVATYAQPLADATVLLGAGLAWRADAGKDLAQAELEAVVAAHLWRVDPNATDVFLSHHLAVDGMSNSGHRANKADTDPRDAERRAAAAAALVCGRDERHDADGDGRGRSLLAECQRGDHFFDALSGSTAGEKEQLQRDNSDSFRFDTTFADEDEIDLWPPTKALKSLYAAVGHDSGTSTLGNGIINAKENQNNGESSPRQLLSLSNDDEEDSRLVAAALHTATNLSKSFVEKLCHAAHAAALDDSRAHRLRAHHRRLSQLVKKAPDERDDDIWKWQYHELGFFFDSIRHDRELFGDDYRDDFYDGDDDDFYQGPIYSPGEDEDVIDDEDDDDDDEAYPFFDRGLPEEARLTNLRLRRVLDELRVSADLLRWMARLRQLLLARARAALKNDQHPPPSDATYTKALLLAIPSGTRSDIANRLLELLQRAAAVYSRRTAPRPTVRAAFRPAPAFLAELTYDLQNFQSAELARLIMAAV